MCMDELVKKLHEFRGIYRVFWSQNSHWIIKKNHYGLILIVGFDFSSNLTVGSLYIRWRSI